MLRQFHNEYVMPRLFKNLIRPRFIPRPWQQLAHSCNEGTYSILTKDRRPVLSCWFEITQCAERETSGKERFFLPGL